MIYIDKYNEIELLYLQSKVEIMNALVERKGFYNVWLANKLRYKNKCEKSLYGRINAIHMLFFGFYKFQSYKDFQLYKKSIETGAYSDIEKMRFLIDYFKSNGFTSIEILFPMVKIYYPDVDQNALENLFVNRVMNTDVLNQLYNVYQIIKPWPFQM